MHYVVDIFIFLRFMVLDFEQNKEYFVFCTCMYTLFQIGVGMGVLE